MKLLSNPHLKNNYITQFALQDHLSSEILDALELQMFEMGEFVYHQDDHAHTFYILVEGKLQIDYLHANGNQTIFSIGEPLATLGDLELFETFHAVKNVFVMKKSTLLAVSMNIVRQHGGEDYRFLRFILHQIVKKLDFSSNQLAYSSLPLKSRLARYLLGQSNTKGTKFVLERREVLAGILGGIAVGIQSPIAGSMSQRIGGTASSFIVHVSGAVLSGMLLLLRGGEQIRNWRSLSWCMLASGAFGLILYLTLSQTLPRLGATTAIALIIIGQLVVGMLIDQFGLFGVEQQSIDFWKMFATTFLLAGGYLMIK